MSSRYIPRLSVITAVIVIAVILPVLGVSIAHPLEENVSPVTDGSEHEKYDSTDCWLVIQPSLQDGAETDTGDLLAVVERPQNTSALDGDPTLITHAPGATSEGNTTVSVLPCHSSGDTNEAGNRTLIPLEQISNTTVGTLNRTAREATNAVGTVGHSVGEILNGTVERVPSPTTGTERSTPRTPPESDTEPRDSTDEERRTEPTPIERTSSHDEDRQHSTPTSTENDTAPSSTARPTTPPSTARPTTPSTTATTTTSSTAQTTPATRTDHSRLETDTLPTQTSVQSSSNDSDDGLGIPNGERLPVEPEPKTGIAVSLGATAVRTLLKHGGAAPEAASRLSLLQASIRSRITTVIGSLSRGIVLLRYSRYDDSDPLEHEGRAAVFETIEDTPGIYLSAISDHTELSLSTLRHHLRVLEREQLIMSVKVHGKRRCYPADTEHIELTAALGEGATANVIEALCHRGPATVSELAEELDRDPSTVTHHLQRLADDDIVRRSRSGRVVMNRLSDDVRTYLTEQPG